MSYRYVGHVVSAIEKSDLDKVLNRYALARDEVNHSVRCSLDVLHLAPLSRLCRGRPRPCTRRLPAAGAVFFFKITQASIRTYIHIPISVYVYEK